EHALHAIRRQRLLVAGLRGREHEQRVEALVLDERLFQRAVAVDDVDEVVHHAPLASHDEIEIAQADVEVDHRHLLAAPGQSARKARGGGRLTDTAFPGSHYDDFGQCLLSSWVSSQVPMRAKRRSSPASQAWTGLPASSAGIVSKTRNTPAIETSS